MYLWIVWLVIAWPVDERHNISILLDRTGFAQICQLWYRRCPRFDRAAQLTKGNQWDIQLSGDELEATADLTDLLDTVAVVVVGCLHQLEVVDND